MRTILAGNNKLACDILDWLIKSGEEVVGIVAEGRDTVKKDESWEKPFVAHAKEIAEKNNLPFFEGNINKIYEDIKEINPNLISFCRYIGLIKKPILSLAPKGCTNLHFSLLPQYGGCSPIYWSIKNNEDHTGVTLHYMSEKFDEGDIIDQREIKLKGLRRKIIMGRREIELNSLTAFEAYQQANNIALELFKRNYPLIREGRARRIPMDLNQQTYYKKGEDGLNYSPEMFIDLNRNDSEIVKDFAALYFPPFRKLIGIIEDQKVEIRLDEN